MPEEENLEIPAETVDGLFNSGSAEQRALLRLMFPEYDFPLSIMERVTNFAEACAERGIDPADISAITLPMMLPVTQIMAFIRLCIITAALNEDWFPDVNNPDQEKYWPLQELTASEGMQKGKAFFSLSALPSSSIALAFKSRELANYASTQFFNHYVELNIEIA